MKALAHILYEAIKNREGFVFVKSLPNRFPLPLRFGALSKVHQFLHSLPLQLQQQGQGRGNATAIRINNSCLCFIADQMDMDVVELHRIAEPTKDKSDGAMSVADFKQRIEALPDFTPVGDPIFSPCSQHDGGVAL